MTELDFDELDKAVNDLMQDGSTAPVAQDGVNASQPNPTPELPGDDTPKAEVLSAPVGTMPLAVKRRGRFMDVMASSGGKKPVIDGFVKRQGVTISAPDTQPTDNDQSVAPSADGNADSDYIAQDSSSNSQSSEPENNEPSDYAANPAPVSEWPEPQEATNLDQPESVSPEDTVESDNAVTQGDDGDAHNEDSDQQDHAEHIDVQAEPMDQVTDSEDVTVHDDGEQLTTVVTPDNDQPGEQGTEAPSAEPQEAAMSSPFLPDTKVEKRPLGGSDTASADTDAPAVAATPDMPREYSSDVMSLETDLSVAAEKREDQPVQVAVSSAPAAPQQPTAAQAAGVAATATISATGAIFDTDTYHTPLRQPAKTKSPWLTVIWILVLLIIGSVAGAAYYYFTMQQ